MAKSLWNQSSRQSLVDRVMRLSPDAAPLWGKFSAPQMLAHCNDWMKMATGEIQTAQRFTRLRKWPIKQFAIYWMPWPKGVPTAKELISRTAHDFIDERDTLCRSIESFEARHRNTEFPDHPAFGTMSRAAWGVLGYRHTDHHLRQFGV